MTEKPKKKAKSKAKAKTAKQEGNPWLRKPYKFSAKKKKEFLRLVKEEGMKRTNAIQEVGITRCTLADHLQKEPHFRDALEQAEMDQEKNHNEKVEDALFDAAESGNVTAIQVYLYNRVPERWADKRNLQLTGKDGGPIETVDYGKALKNLSSEELRSLDEIASKLTGSQSNPSSKT
jgi:predicted DNA-binding protein (UPF0251 family)